MNENCDICETSTRTKYTYDADSRRQTMTVSGQAPLNYTFDNASRMTAITQGTTGVSFIYDSDNRRTSLTLPNGITEQYSYDAASQLTGITYLSGLQAPANLSYGYDLAGRRTSVSGTLASTQLPAAVSSAVYNANNQLTQWGTTAMTYDANGSTLNDGMNSYTWDARNRLVSANTNGASFAYDAVGRRVSKTILSANTTFLYDGANAVQELNGSTVTANLVTGGIDERFLRTTASETDNYLSDALGSTLELTNSIGAAEAQYSYGPYGSMSVMGSTSNSYDYTGRETDGLGINYYRARYYSPTTGRFLSEDPLGFEGSGTNLYAYVSNSPQNYADPYGLTQCKKDCDQLKEEIDELAQEIENRFNEYNYPRWNIPLIGAKSRAGHLQQIANKQQQLRDLLNQYNSDGCPPGGLPANAWQLATQSLPALTPSPSGLPLPPWVKRSLPVVGVGIGIGIGILVCPECIVLAPAL